MPSTELNSEERRIQVQLEQGSINEFMAEAARTGSWPEPPKPSKPHHYSHRGGRSYPEASDSDLDPNWNVEPAQISSEERAIGHAAALSALASVRLALDQRLIDRLHEEEHAANLRGETIHPGALWRAHLEKRERSH